MTRIHRECHIGVNYNHTYDLKEKLIREITGFERDLFALQAKAGPVDFSMQQTYKEMIACRQSVLKGLPPEQ
jgi:hypothetical protein